MDCSSVLFTHLKWLVDVTQVNTFFNAVTEIYPISFILYLLFIITMVPFALSICFILLHFLVSFLVFIYYHFYRLKNKVADDKAFDNISYAVALFCYYYGRLCHGYEIKGIDNIPSKGSAVIVYYHGPFPLDYYLMGSHMYLFRNRQIRPVVDQFFTYIPGFQMGLRIMKAVTGPAKACINVLNDGHLLSVAPGGVYEASFGGNNYDLLWRNHLGYAKVAIEAKSPVIPMFTVNIREVFKTTNICQGWLEKLYLMCRIPVVPVYGGGPVKLKTIIGQPIGFDPALTAEELNSKVMMSMKKLIKENQRLPGSIATALLDRVYSQDKLKVV